MGGRGLKKNSFCKMEEKIECDKIIKDFIDEIVKLWMNK